MQLRKESLKQFTLVGIWTQTSVIPVQRSNQLRYYASWELAIKLVRNIHRKGEYEMTRGIYWNRGMKK